MEYTASEKGMIWLCACADVEYREKVALLRASGTPERLFRDWEEIYPTVINGKRTRVYKGNLSERERELSSFLGGLEVDGYFALTLFSADYPESLKNIPTPPLVLYGKGNRELLKKRKFCIVGSRKTLPWAEAQSKKIAEQLSEHFTIVTGFAEGGDRSAIDGALDRGNLICVLPLGLNLCYPSAHASLKERVAKRGLLLSEYLPNEKLQKHHFHARNRILAGLSEGVLIVSGSNRRSGTLITSSRAAEYGRDVFAFPYNLGIDQGSGCNELIKNGAFLVTEVEDILSVYGIEKKKTQRASLTAEEERVLNALKGQGELHVAVLANQLGLQPYELAPLLASLELKNLVVKSGGNRYTAL